MARLQGMTERLRLTGHLNRPSTGGGQGSVGAEDEPSGHDGGKMGEDGKAADINGRRARG